MQAQRHKNVTMFTQCPECQEEHIITVEQLRQSRGMICCQNCATMFDALELLSDESKKTMDDIETGLPWEPEPESIDKANNTIWLVSSVACTLLLISQFIYFEAYNLTQHPTTRPWLVKTCQLIGCQLPIYNNLNDFSVIQGSLNKADNNSYSFHAVISNQSRFSQELPKIKLKLSTLTGKIFAQRSFSAQEYKRTGNKFIAGNETIEVSLTIAAPDITIGGYSFELI